MRTSSLVVLLSGVLLAAGCMSTPMLRDKEMGHRMPAYVPYDQDIVLDRGNVERSVPALLTNAVVPETQSAPEGVGRVSNTDAVAVAGEAPPVTNAAAVLQSSVTPSVQTHRILSRGDRVLISLRGIPRAEEIKNVIDGKGEVTLPYIGQVRVADLTPSEAERVIETAYIDGGIYRGINVIVVAEDKVYFVQGEVSRQGKFSMSGYVTLLQAITEAGGYTPYANKKNVKIIRGDQVLFFNAREIENGKEQDPAISSDDIIVVQKSVF